MAVEIHVPELGESVADATVGRWLKGEGDAVKSGEALVELETDKINFEVEAEQDGVLESISKGEGETVGVGDVIGTIGEGEGTADEDVEGGGGAPAPDRGHHRVVIGRREVGGHREGKSPRPGRWFRSRHRCVATFLPRPGTRPGWPQA